ncbi:hypothetical protein AAFF_G00103380 [Aldrovandia affinis]|uniref:Uncharacterized protein n=1 Tax=Aldrovandia affinis TaxID=143900 RepID=A0AAD7RUB2_9TELE|nr:hypothetical protein AAFF_G00103380 [Aldrovandia affinis]
MPWSFMDMVGLAGRLPDLTEGAGKLITALEESTGGIRLTLGDMKALLMHVVGKHVTDGIFQQTGLSHLRDGHVADYVGFNGHRTKVWGQLRRLYPDKLDPSKLEGEELKKEHIMHHVEQYRKEEKDADEQGKQLGNKLTQLQLGEFTKVKKDREKADKEKTQAPVVVAHANVRQSG